MKMPLPDNVKLYSTLVVIAPSIIKPGQHSHALTKNLLSQFDALGICCILATLRKVRI